MIGILLGRALSENIMGEELVSGETYPANRVEHDDHTVNVDDILSKGEMIQSGAAENSVQQEDDDFLFGTRRF